jgi:hypothetical protein
LALDVRPDEWIAIYQQALKAYADADFWNDDMGGASLAEEDRGKIA